MRRIAGAALCAALLSLFGAAPALGAVWDLRQLPVEATELSPFANGSKLFGVSCVSESLCVAVGESGAVASSTNPTGGAGAWKIVRPRDFSVETDYCRLVPGPNWVFEPACEERYMHHQVRSISCPSASLCVAVTFEGYVYSSTDPTGPVTGWRMADVDGSERDTHLESISCPDPGFCVAVSGDRYTAGKVLTTNNPTGPGSAWQVVQLDPSLDLAGVSCSSRSFCIAVANGGRILKSTNPGGGAGAWELVGTPGGPGNLEGVACLDAMSFLCLAGNSGGNLLSSKTPGAALSSWGEANGGASVPITGVSCPSPSHCAAVDNNGNVLASADPSVAGSWSIENLIPFVPPAPNEPPHNALFGVSCPTTGLCVLVGTKGRVFTGADAFTARSTGSASGNGKGRRIVKRPRARVVKVDRFREVTRRDRLKVGFRFFAWSKARGFVCKKDSGPYRRCRSPLRYWVPIGKHVLRVRAIGPTGLRGPAARIRFEAVKNPNFN